MLTVIEPAGATNPLLQPARELALDAARAVAGIGRDLEAARLDLMHTQARIRWWSPAAQAHQALLTLDLRRLEEAQASCVAAAEVLRRLGGAQ